MGHFHSRCQFPIMTCMSSGAGDLEQAFLRSSLFATAISMRETSQQSFRDVSLSKGFLDVRPFHVAQPLTRSHTESSLGLRWETEAGSISLLSGHQAIFCGRRAKNDGRATRLENEIAGCSQTATWPWVKTQIVPPVNISIPTRVGSKMRGAPKTPKWDPIGFELWPQTWRRSARSLKAEVQGPGAAARERECETAAAGAARLTARGGLCRTGNISHLTP